MVKMRDKLSFLSVRKGNKVLEAHVVFPKQKQACPIRETASSRPCLTWGRGKERILDPYYSPPDPQERKGESRFLGTFGCSKSEM